VEHRLRVFENRVLRKIFGPKRDEVPGEWRRLHNEKLYDLHSSPNYYLGDQIKKNRWAGHVARMGNRRGAYRVLVTRPDRKRPLETFRLDGGIIWIFKKWDGGGHGLDLWGSG
jgi:hypothetical protein